MHIPPERIYQFGPFSLDARRYRLYKDGELVQLTPKTCEILLLLVERAGALVNKDQIRETIWPDQIIDESNLTHHIYKLRKILGDNQKSQDYILTIPGKGYIFSYNVHQLPSESEVSIGQSSSGAPPQQPVPLLPNGGEGAERQRIPNAPGHDRWSGTRRSRWSTLLVLGATLLITLVVALVFFRNRTSPSLASVTQQVIPLVTLPGEETDVSFSPDGRYLAFTSEGETQDNQDVYIRMIDEEVLWQVTSHPDNDRQATWSPDGTRLAFLRSTNQYAKAFKLIIVPVRGGVEEEIGEVSGGLSWSPDGKYLAVSGNDGDRSTSSLCLLSVDGRERRVLTAPEPNVYDTNHQFSPDGKKIAFVRWKNNIKADLFLFTLASGELKQLTFDDNLIADFHWDFNGQDIYFISIRNGNKLLWHLPVGGGEPVLTSNSPLNPNSIAISPDGKLLVYTQPVIDTQIDIYRLQSRDLRTSNSFCKINSSRADDTPRFSPDGSRIVFVSTRSGKEEIWIANADCSNPFQVTRFNQHGIGSPRWSPDGQWIVFDRNINDNSDIFTIRANGTELRQLTSDKAVENIPSWSRNGEWIYFGSEKTSISKIYRLPAAGGETMPVTSSPGREPLESTDGKSLYYTNGDRLWRKDLLNGQEAVVPELADVRIGRYWDIAGTTLYYIASPTSGRPQVMTFNLESRKSAQLFELSGSLARWVPGIVFNPKENLIAIGYVANRLGDISLVKGWR